MRPILLTALLAFPLLTAAAKPQPELVQIAKVVQQARLHATVAKLVSFGTRHTLSDRTSATRGIGAAERWSAAEFEAISKDCGGCLTVAVPKQTFTGGWRQPRMRSRGVRRSAPR